MKNSVVSLSVNGVDREILVAPGTTLLNLLREQQSLTGTRRGCDQGTCGSCTVMVDGKPKLSCLIAVETIDGAKIETVESLAPGNDLHPLQQAFIDGYATQCGFCTSGMIMAAKGLLARNANPNRDDVIRAISGNVCRCTGYDAIVDAILVAAKKMAPPLKKTA
jgi:aerobic carbon-monoxide dehydrogenase small subunit